MIKISEISDKNLLDLLVNLNKLKKFYIYSVQTEDEDSNPQSIIPELENLKIISVTSDFIRHQFIENNFYRRLLENKIVKKNFMKNKNNLEGNKFLYSFTGDGLNGDDKNYLKFLEVKAFHFLINSNFFSNSSSDSNENITKLFLNKEPTVYNKLQNNLRSLNYENIFKINSKLKRIITDLRSRICSEETTFSKKFYFEENLSQEEIIQIIKNKNNPILIKDFTIAYESINFNKRLNIIKFDELNDSCQTIFNITINEEKNIKRKFDLLFDGEYTLLISIDEDTNENFCVLHPSSLLVIEDISIEMLPASCSSYFKIECSLSKGIFKNYVESSTCNSPEQKWNSFITKINTNSVNYSDECLYLIDFLLYTKEYKEKSVKLAEDLLFLQNKQARSCNLTSSDYLLLGKVYNYVGGYHRSNLFYQRSQNAMKGSSSDNSLIKNIINFCININMSCVSNDEQSAVKASDYLKLADKYYKEIYKEKIALPLIDLEYWKTLYVSQALYIENNMSKALRHNTHDKEWDFKYELNSPKIYDRLVSIYCYANDWEKALPYYKNLIKMSEINFYLNVFIGAIHLNIIQGLKSKYSFYKQKSIEGYTNSDFKEMHKDIDKFKTKADENDPCSINRLHLLNKEVSISLIKTKEFPNKVTFIIPDVLMYYPCYYQDNKKFLDSTIIIKILPFSLIELDKGNNIYIIKENIVLEKLSEVSLQTFEKRYFFYFKNNPFRFQRKENLEECKNVIEILNELYFLVKSFNSLKNFDFDFLSKKLLLDLMLRNLERISFLMILPQIDLWDIVRKFKFREENSLLKSFFVIFKFCVKGSIDLLKKFHHLYDVCSMKLIEYLVKKVNLFDKEENYQKEKEFFNKIKSESVKKLFVGKFNLSEFIFHIENKFSKKDIVSDFLLKSFVLKYLKSTINKNLLLGLIEKSENILNKNLYHLRYDGKNSLNIFILKKIIQINKLKKKIEELTKNNNTTLSKFKIKCEINNLQEELGKLFHIFKENFSYLSNRKNYFSILSSEATQFEFSKYILFTKQTNVALI